MDDKYSSSEQYICWNKYMGEEAKLSKLYLLKDKFRQIVIENPDKWAEAAEWYYNEVIKLYEYDDEEIANLQKIYMKTFGKKFVVQRYEP